MPRTLPSAHHAQTIVLAVALAAAGCASVQDQPDATTPPDDGGIAEDGADNNDGGEADGEAGWPEACLPQCTPGERVCVDPASGDTRFRLCVTASDGCPVWGPPTECTPGTFCEEGRCVETCTDTCDPEGAVRCGSVAERQTCVRGPQGCLVWGTPEPWCGSGLRCTGAAECVPCEHECSEGEIRCASSRDIRACAADAAGCRLWAAPVRCPGTEVCWDSRCTAACYDLCAAGARRCLGAEYQTCQRFSAPTPCLAWTGPFPCPSGRSCVGEGICPTCADACTEGAARCATATSHQRCERSPATGCTAWTTAVSCDARERCEGDGTCVPICTDACPTPGARECGPDGAPRRCVVGALGCTEWVSDAACAPVANGSNVCVDGACSLTCDGGFLRCGPAACRTSCTPWAQQNPAPPVEDLAAIDFAGNTVWAVGNYGVVARSDDAGAAWRNVGFAPDATHLRGVEFVDADLGWAVGDGGVVLRSVDGGRNWAAQAAGTTANLRSVSFADASRGWAVGDGGTIIATTDGGATWTPQSSGVASNLLSVHFVSASTGWAAGAGGRILRTSNGGVVWVPQTSGTTADIQSVRFVDANVGWAAGGNYVLRTTNGGAAWTAFYRSTIWCLGVRGVSDSTATVVGQSGRIEATTDGGAIWTARTTGVTSHLNAIAFLDASRAVVVGQAGTAITSPNSGVTWVDRRSGILDGIRAIRFVGPLRGWAAGLSGRILATSDGGAAWTPQTSGTTRNLAGTWFVDANRGWAVGDAGTIVATSNGGAAWSVQASATVSNLAGVHFPDASNGWAVGSVAGGTPVFYTPDGGGTWQAMVVPGVPAVTMSGVWFNPCSGAICRGWIVGTGGTIRYTTNYGTSWQTPTATGTTQTLYGVQFVNDTTGFAVGAGGTVVATTNGGATWTVRGTAVTATLFDIEFASVTVGYAVGSGATLLKTTDGGTSWNARPVPTGRALRGVAFADASVGWVAGDSGTILATRSGGE